MHNHRSSLPQLVTAAVTSKLTQDFVTQDPLSSCRRLRPIVVPTDSSLQIYCLSDQPGVGLPVWLHRDPSGSGWVQDQLSTSPGSDIVMLAAQDGNAPGILSVPYVKSPPSFPPQSAVLAQKAPLEGAQGPGAWQAWPESWNVPAIAGPLALSDVVVPFLSAPIVLTGERRPTLGVVPFFVQTENGQDAGSVNWLHSIGAIDAAQSDTPIQALPCSAGKVSFLCLNSAGSIVQWTGDPSGALGLLPPANQLPSPTPGAFTSFTMAASPQAQALEDGGRIVVVALSGSAGWSTLTGQVNAAAPGMVTWDEEWEYVCPRDAGGNPIIFTQAAALIGQDNLCALHLLDQAARLNRTTLDLSRFNSWSELLVLGTGVQEVAPFIDAEGDVGFVTVGAEGLIVSTRQTDVGGDWQIERISLTQDVVAKPESTFVYRCGITLTDEYNVGIGDAEVMIETSTETPVMIQGRRYDAGPGRVITTRTDGSGSVWVTADVDPAILAAPAVAFRSSVITGGQIDVRPDAAVADYMGVVSATDLQTGSDPSGVPVLPAQYQADAQAVADALRQIHGIAAPLYEDRSEVLAGVRLTSARGASLHSLRAAGDWPSVAPGRGGAWSFSTRSGRAVFRNLEAAEFQALFRGPIAASPAEVGGLFGIDWGDVWDSVVEGVTEVVDVVVGEIADKVTAAITFVIDGIETVISTVLDAASQAFDLVTGIFAQLGTLLGTVTGWLVKMVGYLFGWKEILDRRDALRDQVQALPAQLLAKYPDPTAFIGQVRSFVQTLKDDFQDVAASVTGPANGDFGVSMQTWPDLPGALGDVLSPVSWLFEKLSSATGNIGALSPSLDPTVSAAWTKFRDSLGGTLSSGFQVLATGVAGGWMTGAAALAAGKPSDLLAPLAQVISGIADALLAAIDAFEELVRAVWSAAGLSSLVEALALAPSNIPFLSGFYKGLTNNDLSMLDVACLAGAIIDDNGTSNLTSTDLGYLAQVFLWVGIGTRAIASAVFSFGGASMAISIFDVLDTAVCLIVSLFLLLLADVMSPWFMASGVYIFSSIATFVSKLIPGPAISGALTALVGLIGLLTALVMFAKQQDVKATLFTLFDGVALLMSAVAGFFVETGKPMPGAPASAIVYTLIQTGLATGCAVTYKLSQDSQPAPA